DDRIAAWVVSVCAHGAPPDGPPTLGDLLPLVDGRADLVDIRRLQLHDLYERRHHVLLVAAGLSIGLPVGSTDHAGREYSASAISSGCRSVVLSRGLWLLVAAAAVSRSRTRVSLPDGRLRGYWS